MLSELEACQTLLDHARQLACGETVDIANAANRVCAKDVVAPIDVPGEDNSAMDGIACHSQSVSSGMSYRISQRIAAGSTAHTLEPNTVARIFTGASLPVGADSIILQEDCEFNENLVKINTNATAGQHIRKKGEDIAKGSVVLKQGDVIGPAQISVIASLGISHIEVYKKLTVAVVTTGNELLEPGEQHIPHKRFNSNSHALCSVISQLGFSASANKIIADSLDATMHTLEKCAEKADIVISTGGVSVGEEDYIKAALQNVGTMHVWKIAVKPGKPLVFGHIGDTPFFGLPGNPVSAMVTFLIFARPYMLRCAGISNDIVDSYYVTAGFDWQTKNRAEYLRASISEQSEKNIATLFHSQDSSLQTSLQRSDGLIHLDCHSIVAKGDTVRFIPFSSLMNLTP